MLKIYKVRNYVSVDGADWRQVIRGWLSDIECKASNEDLDMKYMARRLSFDEAREYLNGHKLDGVWNDTTFWRKKPTICVRYCDAWDDVIYKHFNTLSYKQEYEEWTDVSLQWIIKNLPADQTIQYLKERGITTCPMNF